MAKYERHGTYFSSGTEDTVWLPFVGERGWMFVTKDKKIRFNELEKLQCSDTKSGSSIASGNFSASITKTGDVHLRLPGK
jgi:hypothetical protein